MFIKLTQEFNKRYNFESTREHILRLNNSKRYSEITCLGLCYLMIDLYYTPTENFANKNFLQNRSIFIV